MSGAQPFVVLVHGLWMHGFAMELQRIHLGRLGFEAHCHSYHSVGATLSENARQLADFARTRPEVQIHWLGHGLGGLVILRMLELAPDLPPGRVVLVGTPAMGSYAARMLARHHLGELALGRSLTEWYARSEPHRFPGRDIGVIAGTRSFGLGTLLVAPDLPEPNDGVVTVEETAWPDARDRVVLPVSHSGMLLSRPVAVQAAAFLRHGRFEHGATTD